MPPRRPSPGAAESGEEEVPGDIERGEMGGILGKGDASKHSTAPSKLETKMAEALQKRALAGTTMKSFNNIILKFGKIDQSFRNCMTIFQQFDEDSNGSIDPEELKHCLQRLEISLTEEETEDLFEACDIREKKGMQFNEFIILLCLVYLLQKPSPLQAQSVMGLSDLEATFESLVDAFVFLDNNKDGYVSKEEMILAMDESPSGEQSSGSGSAAIARFEEMDWDQNGMVNFKEFLFAFTRWVGIDDTDDVD